MASIEYSLFRAKFIRPVQGILFPPDVTSETLFLEALSAKPSVELRMGYTWHVGNINYFSENTGYFAVGRTTKSTAGKYDAFTRDFVEEEREESPYTHCVFDAGIGIIGIAKKAGLAWSVKGIATRIEQLLSQTMAILQHEISIEIPPIPDPEGFLHSLAKAYKVSSFTATFRGPNPFDADEYFQKPISKYLSAANGEKGKAQIKGQNLDREVLQAVTRSTAATGNEASARITKSKTQRPITINLVGNPIKRSYAEDKHDPKFVLEDLITTYKRIRMYEGNQS